LLQNKSLKVKTYLVENRSKLICLLLGILFLVCVSGFDWNRINSYQSYDRASLHYVKAVVTSVESETLERDAQDGSLMLGEQVITVTIKQGSLKDQERTFSNFLTKAHNIRVKKGQHIIVCADMPEGADPYFTVYTYDRTVPTLLLILSFAACMLFVGREKGFYALLGVVFSLLTVLLFWVQAIYHGFSPTLVTVLTVLLAGGVSLVLLNGATEKTAITLISTVSGIAVTGVIFFLFSYFLHLSGYNTEAAETLILASQYTGLKIRWILLASVLISALGAVMDVAVSLTAALDELLQKLTQQGTVPSSLEIMKSGMNIGRDMIGTMSNTLILAFAGSAQSTMLCLLAYGFSYQQLFSSDFLTIELAQGLCATIGVILSVPITTWIFLLFHKKQTGVREKINRSKKV